MDALSAALNAVRMTGAIFFHAECAAPWGFAVPSVAQVQHVLSPGTERLVNYNLVTEGRAVARFGDGTEIALRPGDLTILPHGDAHTVSNGSPRTFIDSAAGLADILQGSSSMMRFGESGEITRFICGFFGCERSADRLFLASLPQLIRINIRDNPGKRMAGDFDPASGVGSRIRSARALHSSLEDGGIALHRSAALLHGTIAERSDGLACRCA